MKVIKKHQLDDRDVNRIVEMAWEDRTPFEAIEVQFGLTEAEVIKLMKHEMRLKNWKKWRARVQGRKTKHAKLRQGEVERFQSKAQRHITKNNISKKKY
ncbi:MAG: TIGR03643 family protein [Saprospiraceae bacterium]|nr:TIGR03643 family protein [Saprospiraceae bacterium]